MVRRPVRETEDAFLNIDRAGRRKRRAAGDSQRPRSGFRYRPSGGKCALVDRIRSILKRHGRVIVRHGLGAAQIGVRSRLDRDDTKRKQKRSSRTHRTQRPWASKFMLPNTET